MQKFAAPLFFAVVCVAILYAGWEVWQVQWAYKHIADAPQGQAVGPPDADVVIAEFMDYRCKPCRQLFPVMQQVVKNHPEVRLVIRHRSVTALAGLKEAQIALAAGMQGKFMAMHEILITRDNAVEDREIDDLCAKAGVECGRLKADMTDPNLIKSLETTERIARALDIKHDPAFLIGKNLFTTHRGKPTAADFDRLIAQAKIERASYAPQVQPEPAAAVPPKG